MKILTTERFCVFSFHVSWGLQPISPSKTSQRWKNLPGHQNLAQRNCVVKYAFLCIFIDILLNCSFYKRLICFQNSLMGQKASPPPIPCQSFVYYWAHSEVILPSLQWPLRADYCEERVCTPRTPSSLRQDRTSVCSFPYCWVSPDGSDQRGS